MTVIYNIYYTRDYRYIYIYTNREGERRSAETFIGLSIDRDKNIRRWRNLKEIKDIRESDMASRDRPSLTSVVRKKAPHPDNYPSIRFIACSLQSSADFSETNIQVSFWKVFLGFGFSVECSKNTVSGGRRF